MTEPPTDPGKAEGKEERVKGEIEIPNLSDENEVEEIDVSLKPPSTKL